MYFPPAHVIDAENKKPDQSRVCDAGNHIARLHARHDDLATTMSELTRILDRLALVQENMQKQNDRREAITDTFQRETVSKLSNVEQNQKSINGSIGDVGNAIRDGINKIWTTHQTQAPRQ